MPTISAKVNEKELDAIVEYANQCGETVSNLVRKAMMREITFADGFGDGEQYEYQMSIPELGIEKEEKVIEDNFNKIRRILGWKEISFT